jgi:hypothetical protein
VQLTSKQLMGLCDRFVLLADRLIRGVGTLERAKAAFEAYDSGWNRTLYDDVAKLRIVRRTSARATEP